MCGKPKKGVLRIGIKHFQNFCKVLKISSSFFKCFTLWQPDNRSESKQKSGPVESTEPLGVSGPILRGSKGKPGVVPGFDKWENDVPE